MSGEANGREGRISLHVRVPTELLERLRDEADQRDVSVNFLAVRAFTRYLENLAPVDEVLATVPAGSRLSEQGDT